MSLEPIPKPSEWLHSNQPITHIQLACLVSAVQREAKCMANASKDPAMAQRWAAALTMAILGLARKDLGILLSEVKCNAENNPPSVVDSSELVLAFHLSTTTGTYIYWFGDESSISLYGINIVPDAAGEGISMQDIGQWIDRRNAV